METHTLITQKSLQVLMTSLTIIRMAGNKAKIKKTIWKSEKINNTSSYTKSLHVTKVHEGFLCRIWLNPEKCNASPRDSF